MKESICRWAAPFGLLALFATLTSAAGEPEPFGKGGFGKIPPIPITGNVGITGTPNVHVISLPPVTLSSSSGITVKSSDAGSVFSVPFVMSGAAGANLIAVLKLQKPAILDGYFGNCNGAVEFASLAFDGGPKGTEGTTNVADSGTRFFFVLPPTLNETAILFTPYTFNGFPNSLLPPTHVGLPIDTTLELNLFSRADSSLLCSFTFIFKEIN